MIEDYKTTKLNQKKIIKFTSIGVLGLSVTNLIISNSNKVDKFFFTDIKGYLTKSNFDFLLTPVPNWFAILLILSAGAVTYHEIYIRYFKKVKV